MTVLVTGGTGFIGAEVVRLLLERGEQPFVFHRGASTERLDDVTDKVTFIKGDLGNFSHVLNAVEAARPTAIYHLGAMLLASSEADPSAAMQTNAMGTFHVLEAARLFDVPQVLFSSTLGTYGAGIHEETIHDDTLQRPEFFYGITKVFGEHLGLFYKRKYELDFRGIRYPAVVGPGSKTPGVSKYTSWVIEECAKGNPFTITVTPETRLPVTYFKDGARAIIDLAEAPLKNIKTVNYVVDGVKPTPSARELADIVRARLPGAQIGFKPDLAIQKLLDKLLLPLDDSNARREWGWNPEYDQELIVDDFLQELELHPQRYL